MSEERKGRVNAVQHVLRFYARRAQEAWGGSWNVANAWQLLLALLLLSGGAWLAGVRPHYPDIPYSQPIGMGLFMSTAWFAVFLVQFMAAPPRLARLDAEVPMLERQSTALSVTPIRALSTPEPTPPVLVPPDLPLLDRPLLAQPLLDLSSLDALPSNPPPADLPLIDRPLLLPPLLDLSSLDSLPSNPPPSDLPPLDQPLLVQPLLDLSSLDSLPSNPPPSDLPPLDQPLLVQPLLDLSSLDALPSNPPPADLPLIDGSLLLPPMLDLSSLGALPSNPPPSDLPRLDGPLLLPPLLDLSSLDALPSNPPPSDLPRLDGPLLLPPMLDLSSLDALPSNPPSSDLPLLDGPLLLPPMLDLSSLDLAQSDLRSPGLPPSNIPSRDFSVAGRPLRHRLLRGRPLVDPPPPDLQSEPRAPAAPPVQAPTRPVRSTIDVRLHDQIYETTAVDATGDRLPASRAYRARVSNHSDQTVHRCQLFFCNPMNIQVVSGPFDLAPGEHRDLPALRVIDEADEPRALLYFLDAETWHVAQGQAAWLPEPGPFKIKVLSANAPPSALEVKLVHDAQMPFAWTLVEATKSDKAPRAGRMPSVWASSDSVAEPSLGD
ncbi:hypothetical protein [Reyranella sp.]|uniref:hypothetical protein n=1 Tax=Reyranella sp. TaxID=1929291 RepID=UPI003D0B44F4